MATPFPSSEPQRSHLHRVILGLPSQDGLSFLKGLSAQLAPR